MDKIYQAIQEVLIETSDDLRAHLDPDIIHLMANRVATFLVKGIGNPNPMYDLFVQAHNEGKYPANTAQGRGDNLRDYANRAIVMVVGPSLAGELVKKQGGKSLLTMGNAPPQAQSYRDLSEEHTLPRPPKASEKEPQPS